MRRYLQLGLFLAAAVCTGAGEHSVSAVHWVGSWATSQQLVEPQNSLATAEIRDVTLRQIVHVSIGGSQIRLRLSNRFGNTPLHLTAVHIARPVSPASDRILQDSDRALAFSK